MMTRGIESKIPLFVLHPGEIIVLLNVLVLLKQRLPVIILHSFLSFFLADGSGHVAYVSGYPPHDRRSAKRSPIISISMGVPSTAQTQHMLGEVHLPGGPPPRLRGAGPAESLETA